MGVEEDTKSNFGGSNFGEAKYLNHRKLAGFKDGPSFSELLMFTHRSSGRFGGGEEVQTPDERTDDADYTLTLTHRGRKSLDADASSMTIDPSSRSLKAIKMVRRQRQVVSIAELPSGAG